MIRPLPLAAILATGCLSVHANFVEDFTGFTSATPPLGTSSLPNGTLTENIAPGVGQDRVTPVNNAAQAHPRTTDTVFIRTTGNVGNYIDYTTTPGLPLAAGNIIQFALPIRVDSLDAAGQSIDLIRFRAIAGANQIGLVSASGTLRLPNNNGWGTANIFSTTAFNPAAPLDPGTNIGNRWNDGLWRVLIVRAILGAAGTGSVRGWIQHPNGTQNLVVNATGINNVNLMPNGVERIGFGATYAGSPNLPGLQLSFDNLFIGSSLAEADFLNEVLARYANPATVSDWSLY